MLLRLGFAPLGRDLCAQLVVDDAPNVGHGHPALGCDLAEAPAFVFPQVSYPSDNQLWNGSERVRLTDPAPLLVVGCAHVVCHRNERRRFSGTVCVCSRHAETWQLAVGNLGNFELETRKRGNLAAFVAVCPVRKQPRGKRSASVRFVELADSRLPTANSVVRNGTAEGHRWAPAPLARSVAERPPAHRDADRAQALLRHGTPDSAHAPEHRRRREKCRAARDWWEEGGTKGVAPCPARSGAVALRVVTP